MSRTIKSAGKMKKKKKKKKMRLKSYLDGDFNKQKTTIELLNLE